MENRQSIILINSSRESGRSTSARIVSAADGRSGEKLCGLVRARLRRPGTYRTDALVARSAAGIIPPRITPSASGCAA